MIFDVVLYTLARIVLVVAVTAAIFFGARVIGVQQLPLVVALLFAIVIALPLGIWCSPRFAGGPPAGIAAVDERRRTDREQLQSRLRGDKPGTD